MGKNTDKIFNNIYSSRSGKAARRAQHKWEEKNRKLKERHNKYQGTDGKEKAMVLNVSQTEQGMAGVHNDPQVGGVIRVRPEHMDSITPALNDGTLSPAQQNKNVGMQPLRLVEIDPENDSTVLALQAGGQVSMGGFGRGSLETDGNTNHSRATAYQPMTADGLPLSGQNIGTAGGAFGGQSGTPIPLPENTPADIKKFAGSYDTEDSIPNKSQHAPKLAECHPEITPYVKAFIYRCWTEKETSIRINSTYRSPAHQKRLRDKWDNGDAQYKKDHAKPASPGSSWHNTGMAFDFNPKLKNGVTLMKATDKATWQNSGVPAIGEAVGMRWGGHFSSNYDPIHFDLGSIYNNSFKKDLVNKALSSGVEANRVAVADVKTV